MSLGIGDWVYFRCMGAYTLAAGSTFNGMPRPSTVHVCGEIAARRLTGEGRCDIILDHSYDTDLHFKDTKKSSLLF